MSKTHYAAKFKDPRWQKKRLEVLQAAGFQCQECNAKDHELHVHHRCYNQKAEPWEYGADEMVALCSACHADLHGCLDEIKALLGATTDTQQLMRIAGYIAAVVKHPQPSLFTSPHFFGFADYYRTAPSAVYALSFEASSLNTPLDVPFALAQQVVAISEDDL